MLKSAEAGDGHVASTCAHEYGHILQFKLKLQKTVFAGQPTSKRQELHANFLAGYFVGVSKLGNRNDPAAVFATDHYDLGDYNIRSKNITARPTSARPPSYAVSKLLIASATHSARPSKSA